MPNILLGTDPEIFARSAHGAVIPAWEFLDAEPLAKDPRIHHTYWDGVQAELSVPPSAAPAATALYVRRALQDIYTNAQRFDPSARLHCADTVEVAEDVRANAPEPCITFGCSPSSNIYNIPPIAIKEPRNHPIRYAGCHLHASTSGQLPAWWPEGVIQVLDRTAGVVFTGLCRGLEDPQRRAAYGRPGEFRVADNRLEYRTPSALLLRHPKVFKFALELFKRCFELGLSTHPGELPLPASEDAIMACDADWCARAFHANIGLFDTLMQSIDPSVAFGLAWQSAITRGMTDAGFCEHSVEHNWHLTELTPQPIAPDDALGG